MNMHINPALIAGIAERIRELLGEDFDERTFCDTLEGETPVFDWIDVLLADLQNDNALANALADSIGELTARKRRIVERGEARRTAIGEIMDAAGLQKVERPLATVSRTAGRMRAVIVDEAAIPSQLCIVTRKPDATAIRRQLDAGEDVPGVRLERGPDGITVRVK